ncbi:MAG: sprT domain-containing protein [Flavobacteriaceae bacterium]|nr:MAG: sprT domain-containing protein [Flavobacteriaceae bacterium]
MNFSKYIPEKAVPLILLLIDTYTINLKIVNERQTKHGDFKRLPNGELQITVNNNLNPYQFLLTLIHEIAHQVAYLTYGKIKPHGKEWKQTFQHLILPFLTPEIYPDAILKPLANYLKNPKASTGSDVNLTLALKGNSAVKGKSFIFDLPLGDIFIFKGMLYKKGIKRRTRYECLQIKTNKTYLFNQNAEVKMMTHE